MRSLVSIEQQSPRRPCDILVINVGPEVAKTAKTVKTAKFDILPKNCQNRCKANKEASRLYVELLLCVCWHTEYI